MAEDLESPARATHLFGKSANNTAHLLRLEPGDEVVKSVSNYCFANGIAAGSIISAVGSLTMCVIRYAHQTEHASHEGHFEVLSLSGMVSKSSHHVHISIADGSGKCVGGHLIGGIVYTTLEIAILSYHDVVFSRGPCALSGYDELEINESKSKDE